ncbi:hypothetical protein JDV02_000956 [Purpureocillium takamizusanense]|uniref:Uncharacterized protein n=1 Tax=Purpureocillium takamizusanense TaxID=2060973 RepID=A0A9Q8V7D3_9HYPO|nr:uncharacterized protein JDV02_000956 [Purpureocillium takamizusanense]UNI14316.1 hypothetical protein JDV02_000956 [Purpureocillium takamizusanense]
MRVRSPRPAAVPPRGLTRPPLIPAVVVGIGEGTQALLGRRAAACDPDLGGRARAKVAAGSLPQPAYVPDTHTPPKDLTSFWSITHFLALGAIPDPALDWVPKVLSSQVVSAD